MAREFIHAISGEPLDGAQADYEGAVRQGSVLIGMKYVFLTGLHIVRVLPLNEIVWAYMRREDNRIALCCGKGTLADCHLMLLTVQSELYKEQAGRERYVKGLLDLLIERNPDITIGCRGEHIRRLHKGSNASQG